MRAIRAVLLTLLLTAAAAAAPVAHAEVPHDPLMLVLDTVDGLIRDCEGGDCVDTEEKLCAALAALAPGLPPYVTIDGQGDVYLTGEWFWDCPPYGLQD